MDLKAKLSSLILMGAIGVVLLSWIERPAYIAAADLPSLTEPVNDAFPLKGAWIMTHSGGESMLDHQIEMYKILSQGHFMFAFYNQEKKAFYSAGGGTYTYEDGKYVEIIQFHTIDPKLIGTSLTFDCRLEGDLWHHTGLIGEDTLKEVFERLDAFTTTTLDGAWLQLDYEDENGKTKMKKTGTKKIKILSGGRFQWAQFNEKEGFFLETGGGTYDFKDGIYSEHLQFFARDSTMVDRTIQFAAEVKKDEWRHIEVSLARGYPINETWTRLD